MDDLYKFLLNQTHPLQNIMAKHHHLGISFTLIITDSRKFCHLLHWTLYKSKRFTRSVLGIVDMVYGDSLNMAFMTRKRLEIILKAHNSMSNVTNSIDSFEVLTEADCATEKDL